MVTRYFENNEMSRIFNEIKNFTNLYVMHLISKFMATGSGLEQKRLQATHYYERGWFLKHVQLDPSSI